MKRSDDGDFLRALVLAVAPAVASVIVGKALDAAFAPRSEPRPEADSFAAYLRGRR